MPAPETSIILVNWNGGEHIDDCLASLDVLAQPRETYEVILVDNGSTDGSVERVEQHFPRVRVLRNPENNYAGAINTGIRASRGELVALLNVDTRVESDWLTPLLETLREHPGAGAVTSKIYKRAPRLYAVAMHETEGLSWDPIGSDERDLGQYDGVYRVDFINHCSCLYRRKVLEAVDLLDEEFMMYHEDVDMSIRVRRAGWQLMVDTRSVVHHAVHGSVVQAMHLFNYYTDRNRLFVIAKHYPIQFAEHFPTSRFYRYHYEDDRNDALQRDLIVMFRKWLAARPPGGNLSGELALMIRTLKERNQDPLEALELALELKTEGLTKAVVHLELQQEQMRTELNALKQRRGQTC